MQHTISATVSIEGIGLHTGKPCKLSFHPAPEDHGLVFQRVDIEGAPSVPALVDFVVDTTRGTTLESGAARVHTVEHVLSALAGLNIDNSLISLDGPEPPAMDGSAIAFVNVLKEVGLTEQAKERKYLIIQAPLEYTDDASGSTIRIEPAKEFSVSVSVDFQSAVLGETSADYSTSSNDYSEEIANSRTFCFLHEVEALYEAGLIQGGSLDSAVVLVDQKLSDSDLEKLKGRYGNVDGNLEAGILNAAGLRHENEPARHKLLDLIGDLALLGAPILGKVTATKPGHTANTEMAKIARTELKRQTLSLRFMSELQPGIVFDINAIHEILPHRYPFLLVDKIVDFNDKSIVGIKNVTINEPFFQGHFPGNPIMPGVLQLEAMAQVGGILLLNTIENPKSIWVYILGIDNARFKKPVKPGDTLKLQLEMTALRRGICKMTGKAFVDGILVSSADLIASVVPK